MMRRLFQRWIERLRAMFLDASAVTLLPVITPLPPHVANMRLNMDLMGLHMEQAGRDRDPRTKVGYVLQAQGGEKK